MNILKREFWYDWGWTLHCAVRIEFKMRPSADLWEKWRILSNMRKPKNNIFSELYFDQYEVDVNAKNIRYFEEEEQPFIKVISLHSVNSFSCSRIYCLCSYLIFVIFFTRAKFLENKIYTKKRQFFALNL